jgi:hypothetical protein
MATTSRQNVNKLIPINLSTVECHPILTEGKALLKIVKYPKGYPK